MLAGKTLLLFDIDGTLLLNASREHAQALLLAIEAVYGVSNPSRFLPEHIAGRTDREIARITLEQAGVPLERIHANTAPFIEQVVYTYDELCPNDLSANIAPGIDDLLTMLARRNDVALSLVTGNMQAVAQRKLAAAGIGSFFAAHHGGFGSDHELREKLPEIARKRAGEHGSPWRREQTIVIGDTPRDIACAHADGVRCFAIATGPYGAKELETADHVSQNSNELQTRLEHMFAGQ